MIDWPVIRRVLLLAGAALVIGELLVLAGHAVAGDRYPVEAVVRVIDGDTFVARLSLGQRIFIHRTIHLKDVCAKESWELGGKVATALLAERLARTHDLTVEDVGTSFDRMVGVLWEEGVNLNAEIQEALVAAEVNGGRGTCPG